MGDNQVRLGPRKKLVASSGVFYEGHLIFPHTPLFILMGDNQVRLGPRKKLVASSGVFYEGHLIFPHTPLFIFWFMSIPHKRSPADY